MSLSSWKVMKNSVFALFLRELKTRFGEKRWGYLWALLIPVFQVTIISSIFALIGRNSISDVHVVVFLITGILPFRFFSALLTQLSSGIEANKSLFAYRQVTPIDPIITRLLIETTVYSLIFSIIMGGLFFLGFDIKPDNILILILAHIGLIIFTAGLALCMCSAIAHWPDAKKVLTIINTPMLFMSGVLYSATMLPAQYWYLVDWNPIFHFIEIIRDAYFQSYITPVGSISYVFFCSLIAVATGLALYRVNRLRFTTS